MKFVYEVENLDELPEIKRLYELKEAGELYEAINYLKEFIEKIKREMQNHEDFYSLYSMIATDNELALARASHFKNERILEYLEIMQSTWCKSLAGFKKEHPEYIQKLIDNAYILNDGKTALKSLQKIAAYLAQQGINVTKDLLYKQIMKRDGEPFSESSCEDAARLAKTKPVKAR